MPVPLPGSVIAEWKKCGKPGCKCANGALHGPYYYRFYRIGRRLHRQYVKREQVEEVRARCEATRVERQRRAAVYQEWREMLKALRLVERYYRLR